MRITDATLEEAAAEPLDHLRARFANEIAVQDFYARCRRRGFDYGTDFRLITQLFKEDTQALARIKVSETAQAAGRVIDTCALDACFQVLMTLLPPAVNISKTWLPVGLQSLHVLRQPRKEIWCHAELHSSAANELSANLRLLDEDGRTLAVIRGLAARQASRSDVAGDGFDLEECLYRVAANHGRRGRIPEPRSLR